MMGDGVIDLPAIRRMVESRRFPVPRRSKFSAENCRKEPGNEVLATCVERFRTVC